SDELASENSPPWDSELAQQILSTMTTYKQLWARSARLSIARVGVDKCKFSIVAETFSAQRGSKFLRGFPGPFSRGADSSGTRAFSRGTAVVTGPSKSGKSFSS